MLSILYGFLITFIAYLLAKPCNQKFPQIPVIVFGMCFVLLLLYFFGIPYETYVTQTNPLFNQLLGYVTVALAIPLAAMRYDDLPLKAILGILLFASFSAVALPMGLAYALHMSNADIMAFATRAVTTPIAINIATLLEAPIQLAVLIVILSGVVGAAFSPLILRHINDERASGLALGLAAHAIAKSINAFLSGGSRYALIFAPIQILHMTMFIIVFVWVLQY